MFKFFCILSFSRYYEFNEEILLRLKLLGPEAMLLPYCWHPRLSPPFSYVIDLVNVTEIDLAEIRKTGLLFGDSESVSLSNVTPVPFSPAIWMASEFLRGWSDETQAKFIRSVCLVVFTGFFSTVPN